MARSFTVAVLLVLFLLLGGSEPALSARQALFVELVYPQQGQVLYAGPTVPQYAFPVGGRVQLDDLEGASLAEVTVRLEILKAGKPVARVAGQPDAGGFFEFMVIANPDAPLMELKTDQKECGDCHAVSTPVALPPGSSTLRVVATTPKGHEAVVERPIAVDPSGWADVRVRLTAPDESLGVQGLPVVATTRFPVALNTAAEAQTRYFTATTDERGEAVLRVEALARAPTEYAVHVPPVITDGTLLASRESARFSLAPGAPETGPVVLQVHATRGRITGHLRFPPGIDLDALTLWAVDLDTGRSYQLKTASGLYHLDDLPISRYQVALDDTELAALGLSASPRAVDLFRSSEAEVDFSPRPTATSCFEGHVRTAAGEPVPFAWVSEKTSGRTVRVDPGSGEFSLVAPAGDGTVLRVVAPGFWSQEVPVRALPGPVDIVLRPSSHHGVLMPHGGSAMAPPETVAWMGTEAFVLERGWTWGATGPAPERIELPEGQILVDPASRFAVERIPGGRPWLYVLSGSAQVTLSGRETPTLVAAGNMMALASETVPPPAVSLERDGYVLLHAGEAIPLPFMPDPGLYERIKDTVLRAALGTAGGLAFAVYTGAALASLGGLVVVLYRRRGQRTQK